MKFTFDKASNIVKLILLLIAIVAVISIFVLFIFVPIKYSFLDFDGAIFTIMGASATILSIVFGLSQFILQNASKKYSPKIFDDYENDPKIYRLFFFYSVIIGASILFFVTKDVLITKDVLTILEIFSLILFSFILYIFIINLIFLIEYIKCMFVYINPFKFTQHKKNRIIRAIDDEQEKESEEGYSIIGDIAIKSLSDEEIVSLTGINSIMIIFSNYIGQSDDEGESDDTEV